jgi:hypothetical protein
MAKKQKAKTKQKRKAKRTKPSSPVLPIRYLPKG